MTATQEPIVFGSSALLPGGSVLSNVHSEQLCSGRTCVVHAPSAHHMRTWPLTWRQDRGMFERRCEHGIGHPDPDQRDYFVGRGYRRYVEQVARSEATTDPEEYADAEMTHGCDGCCATPEDVA